MIAILFGPPMRTLTKASLAPPALFVTIPESHCACQVSLWVKIATAQTENDQPPRNCRFNCSISSCNFDIRCATVTSYKKNTAHTAIHAAKRLSKFFIPSSLPLCFAQSSAQPGALVIQPEIATPQIPSATAQGGTGRLSTQP